MRPIDIARKSRGIPAAERFAGRYVVNHVTGCWEWSGSLDTCGYGRLWVDGKQMQAHRFALVLSGVELIPGLEVDHLCRNRACVNPAHLEQVTHAENHKRSYAVRARRRPAANLKNPAPTERNRR